MPRYLVERAFPEGLEIPVSNRGVEICQTVVQRNAELGVTWVHSYVSEDKKTTYLRLRRPHVGCDPRERGGE